MTTHPEIRRMLVISTAHLSRDTWKVLDGDPAPELCHDGFGHRWLDTGRSGSILVIPDEYGWIVYAHDDELDLPPGDSNYPDDLAAIFRFARHHGCDWIKIDRDGPIYGGAEDWAAEAVAGLHLYDDDGGELPTAEVIDAGDKICGRCNQPHRDYQTIKADHDAAAPYAIDEAKWRLDAEFAREAACRGSK